jgi:hypothetical protein
MLVKNRAVRDQTLVSDRSLVPFKIFVDLISPERLKLADSDPNSVIDSLPDPLIDFVTSKVPRDSLIVLLALKDPVARTVLETENAPLALNTYVSQKTTPIHPVFPYEFNLPGSREIS